MIFDSHAHYDDKQFDEDRSELLSSMGKNRITKIVNVGANVQSSMHSLRLAEAYDFVYAAIGVHPSEISCFNEATLQWMWNMSSHRKVVAIGEIGLDYYWDKEPEVQDKQRAWFRRQLRLSRDVQLPVIIHSRDAAADTLEIMKQHTVAENRENKRGGMPGNLGVIHCFSYSREMAEEYVNMGYYIGVGGVLTFKNARKLKESVEAVPIERIVIETDCPYMAPEPNRGKRNSSLYLPYVVEELARIKGMSPEAVEDITYRNAMELYGLL